MPEHPPGSETWESVHAAMVIRPAGYELHLTGTDGQLVRLPRADRRRIGMEICAVHHSATTPVHMSGVTMRRWGDTVELEGADGHTVRFFADERRQVGLAIMNAGGAPT